MYLDEVLEAESRACEAEQQSAEGDHRDEGDRSRPGAL